MRRLPFLPAFLIGLTILFVIVLAVQLRREFREPVPATASAVAVPESAPKAVEPIGELVEVPSPSGAVRATAPARPPLLVPAPNASAPAAIRLPKPVPKPRVVRTVVPPAAKTATRAAHRTGPAQERSGSGEQTSTDPDSDSTPPRLVSIEFVPPQVHDGEQSTVIVTAVDDLSGVRGISGTIGSPTGKALQGFATQREGETDRYVGRVSIPKNAEQGPWRVHFLNLSDQASNSVTLSDARGTVPAAAVLRVISSDSDSTPPVLKNVWADRRSMRGGEKNALYVEATDDNSGVNLVSAVFQSPSKAARIGAGCRRGDGDVWVCELSVPDCVDCGDWRLEQITLQDKANNLATIRQDNPLVQAVSISIMGDSCDNRAPSLQSVIVDPQDIAADSGSPMVTVTVIASDDQCGVSGVSGQYTGPVAGSGGFFPMQASGNGTWVGRIQLDPHAARGAWRINSIQLTDQGHNLRIYYANDPLLQNAVFRVR